MKSLEQTLKPIINSILMAAIAGIAVLWTFWQSQNIYKENLPVSYLQITTINPPAGKSFYPEQRRKFAVEFGKKFKDKGMKATVTTIGDFHTKILIQGTTVNEPLVHEIKDNNTIVNDFREIGFKHLIMTDGKIAWDVDLKN